MSRPGTVAADAPALYASRPGTSRGRLHTEPPSPSRTDFQRDRDRIIHATAFRRLQHKTQVFVAPTGDHYRTRLTHTVEVAQIARSAARALALDEDLSEALALAHDLGHPPFGHAGEDALNEAMDAHGGFDHNVQTFRIVTKLERRYAGFDGLNLTWELLEGMVKHNGPLEGPLAEDRSAPPAFAEYCTQQDLELGTWGGPEAQIASLADDVAYIGHDLDDGVRAGLFPPSGLRDVTLAGPMMAEVMTLYPDAEPARLTHETVRRLIDRMLSDLVAETRRRADAASPRSADEVRALPHALVAFSPEMGEQVRELRAFLHKNMYRDAGVLDKAKEGARIVGELFRHYAEFPQDLPNDWQPPPGGAGDEDRAARRVADYIAGMTDRYAVNRQAEHLMDREGPAQIL
jgi:dGTPase